MEKYGEKHLMRTGKDNRTEAVFFPETPIRTNSITCGLPHLSFCFVFLEQKKRSKRKRDAPLEAVTIQGSPQAATQYSQRAIQPTSTDPPQNQRSGLPGVRYIIKEVFFTYFSKIKSPESRLKFNNNQSVIPPLIIPLFFF